jgi:hypothetical protein
MKKYPILTVLAFMLVCMHNLTANASLTIGETQGIITQTENGSLRVEGDVLTAFGHQSVWVYTENAPLYDLVTGFRVPLTEIKNGKSIRVAYFMDDKPQPYPAVVLWLNSCSDDAAVFTAVVSENIRYGEGYCEFLTVDRKYRITFTDDTYLRDPQTGKITVNDILPGQEFFIWVDSITASCPALVYPDKAVLVY